MPPSAWDLPDAGEAHEDGVVGIGADLHPATLVDAYRRGIFPWPHAGMPLPWFSPDPRGVLRVDEVHLSRSLHRRLRACGWTTTVDHATAAVIEGCASNRGEDGTWISPAMIRAYLRLARLGWVHSVEVWHEQTLVGGVYGVQVGGVLTGESMFHRAPDASKVALLDLVVRFAEAGGTLVDVQVLTDHLRSLGATELSRAAFLRTLAEVRDDPVRLQVGRTSVAGLPARLAAAGRR